MTADRAFQVTGARGLDHSLLPMTLWRKAKKLGTWDPLDIDLEQDAAAVTTHSSRRSPRCRTSSGASAASSTTTAA